MSAVGLLDAGLERGFAEVFAGADLLEKLAKYVTLLSADVSLESVAVANQIVVVGHSEKGKAFEIIVLSHGTAVARRVRAASPLSEGGARRKVGLQRRPATHGKTDVSGHRISVLRYTVKDFRRGIGVKLESGFSWVCNSLPHFTHFLSRLTVFPASWLSITRRRPPHTKHFKIASDSAFRALPAVLF